VLAETVFDVGRYAGVISAVLFDYVQMPHILSRTSLVVSLLGTSSQGPSPSREFQEGHKPP
jgi:hypothetical protein